MPDSPASCFGDFVFKVFFKVVVYSLCLSLVHNIAYIVQRHQVVKSFPIQGATGDSKPDSKGMIGSV